MKKIKKTICALFLAQVAFLCPAQVSSAEGDAALFACSSFEVEESENGRLVGRFRDVLSLTETEQKNNPVLVYSSDKWISRYVGYHFDEEENDPEFTGSTFFSTRRLGGTPIQIREDNRTKEVVLDVAIFYSPEFGKFKERVSNQAAPPPPIEPARRSK